MPRSLQEELAWDCEYALRMTKAYEPVQEPEDAAHELRATPLRHEDASWESHQELRRERLQEESEAMEERRYG